jgi:hypothetical protein
MKRIVFSLLCLFAAGSVAAQTYACQFIMAAGMNKNTAGWRLTEFNVPEPFFLTMLNGLIDTKSVTVKPIGMGSSETKCFKSEFDILDLGRTHWCGDFSDYLSFSEKTLNGGYARTVGGMQSSGDKDADSVAVSRFKCQKVQ